MSRTSGRRSGVEASPEPASTPRSSARTDSPARRQSSSSKKSAAGGEASASKRTASPAGPVRRRAAERAENAAPAARAASPAYIADSLLAKDKVTPLRTPATPSYAQPQGTPYTPYTPFTPNTPGGDHPLSLMRHAADAGKLQLGFHNDQYIEDISVESAHKANTPCSCSIVECR